MMVIFIFGIWLPSFKNGVLEWETKLFGYNSLPYDLKTRRQLEAFFDVFGGQTGKSLLVREEDLNVDIRRALTAKRISSAETKTAIPEIQESMHGGTRIPRN